MLLQDKMKQYPFSTNEKRIIQFLIDQQEKIQNYSLKMIAKETYTSPSTMIRIANKLGFQGWNDFKNAFLQEIIYLQKHFQNIDANIPFDKHDTIMQVANKIAMLHVESIQDTMELMEYQQLQKAVDMLHHANEIKVFAIGNINFIAEEFVYKCNRIAKKASISIIQDLMYHEAAMTQKESCAICISYTGETPHLLQVAKTLHTNHIPLIAITSIGSNHLSHLSDVSLHLTTREKTYSKIAGFSSLTSLSLILDVLYACLFAKKYDENFAYKTNIAKQVETNRVINNVIIHED